VVGAFHRRAGVRPVTDALAGSARGAAIWFYQTLNRLFHAGKKNDADQRFCNEKVSHESKCALFMAEKELVIFQLTGASFMLH